jgi:hypothetical protein
MNFSELLENATWNATEINPALAIPRYEVVPAYNTILWINVIIISIVLKKWNYRLITKLNLKNPRLERLLSTGFLLDMLHWGNLFFLVYNILVPFVDQTPLYI